MSVKHFSPGAASLSINDREVNIAAMWMFAWVTHVRGVCAGPRSSSVPSHRGRKTLVVTNRLKYEINPQLFHAFRGITRNSSLARGTFALLHLHPCGPAAHLEEFPSSYGAQNPAVVADFPTSAAPRFSSSRLSSADQRDARYYSLFRPKESKTFSPVSK